MADEHWSRQTMFRNVSIAEQVIKATFTANYADAIDMASKIAALRSSVPIGQLPDLYKTLNTCFILKIGLADFTLQFVGALVLGGSLASTVRSPIRVCHHHKW
jgi:hypothetical protein